MRPAAVRFVVTGSSERLDRLVSDATGRGRRAVKEWLKAGIVTIDGRIASGSEVPRAGSEVVIEEAAPDVAAATSANQWQVVWETGRYAVVSKAAGVHCVRGRSRGSLAEQLESRYGDLTSVGDDPDEGGLVHRIDCDTSGLVIVARERAAWRALRSAFSEARTRKQYLALARGRVRDAQDIDRPLARRGARMAIAGRYDDALEARTRVEPLESGNDWSLVRATIATGAMHQVRVHLAAIGHPLIGDTTYGGPVLCGCTRPGQLLHAMRVQVEGELDVSAGPPEDFLAAYAQLRRERVATSSF
jgi:23S rRNA pseudouridine1911/1915/1917 synthase